ncbi:hypothetical protein PC117_g24267 [Phytophthora cactorum]|uniref:Uncharacterized protein n=1 Tax=Phytophthora cactorum TaxID=29920 RepID=A0A8T1AY43_9STRA|nr:hypothetical protein PC117_g24267 [Phytophthora cactorum]
MLIFQRNGFENVLLIQDVADRCLRQSLWRQICRRWACFETWERSWWEKPGAFLLLANGNDGHPSSEPLS